MQITLNPEVEKFVQEKVRTGQYGSADDLVNGALIDLMDREGEDEFTPEHRVYLQQEINIGIELADRGEFVEVDLEQIMAEGRRWLAAKLYRQCPHWRNNVSFPKFRQWGHWRYYFPPIVSCTSAGATTIRRPLK
jgi:antitoxin ParD1/3/4